MDHFARILDAFERWQKARAERVIRRYSYFGTQSPNDAEIPEVDKRAAAAPRSWLAGGIKPDIGDVAMPLTCFEKRDGYKAGLVVAVAWLILYGLVFSGFAFAQVAEALASLY